MARFTGSVSEDSILPSQSGHAGEYLTTDGSTLSWEAVGGDAVGSYDGGDSASSGAGTLDGGTA